MKQTQLMKSFYDYTPDRQFSQWIPPVPTDDQVKNYLLSKRCPLSQIQVDERNAGNVRTLQRFAFTALKRPNRSLRGCNFLLCAGSGQGKTFVAKQFIKTVGIPFVFVQSAALNDTWSLFELIKATFENHEFMGDDLCTLPSGHHKWQPIVEDNTTDKLANYVIPPCAVFLDEVHSLKRKMMQGSLLNAMEPNDGYLQVTPPGIKSDSIMVNCKQVQWVGATTERGLLFDAFENRLGTTIEWAASSKEAVKRIVMNRIAENVANKELSIEMPEEICASVAELRTIPREAISFAEKVIQHRQMFKEDNWDTAINIVANDLGLDEEGFTSKQIAILSALGQRPIAEARLSNVARCRIEQVQRYELPGLMSYGMGGPLAVSVSGKGICITKAGIAKLDQRNISNKGDKVTAEYFEAKRSAA